MLNWIQTESELPQKDGTYEICNHPEAENDGIRREMTATAYYDGYGFQYLGVYRIPKYWREHPKTEKKYGKQ
jgi:hypothetical protein